MTQSRPPGVVVPWRTMGFLSSKHALHGQAGMGSERSEGDGAAVSVDQAQTKVWARTVGTLSCVAQPRHLTGSWSTLLRKARGV